MSIIRYFGSFGESDQPFFCPLKGEGEVPCTTWLSFFFFFFFFFFSLFWLIGADTIASLDGTDTHRASNDYFHLGDFGDLIIGKEGKLSEMSWNIHQFCVIYIA